MSKRRNTILQAARKKAGMGQLPKGDVIRYVCDQLQVPIPSSWDARYKLMRDWAQGQTTSKAVKAARIAQPVIQAPTPAVVKGESRRKRNQAQRAQSDAFLQNYEWRRLRMEVIKERGARCECCGATPQKDGIRINVDHVKPRKLFPAMALDKANLQVLCEECNHGKGNWDQTDWRGPEVVTRTIQ